MRISVRRPSPALVISCVALALALGGTGYAAVSALPKNSVGTAAAQDLGGDVREGEEPLACCEPTSHPGQLRQGRAGPAGPAGPPGPRALPG